MILLHKLNHLEFLILSKNLQVFEQNKFQKHLRAFPKNRHFSPRKPSGKTFCPCIFSPPQKKSPPPQIDLALQWHLAIEPHANEKEFDQTFAPGEDDGWILKFQHVRYALFTEGFKGIKWNTNIYIYI